MTHRKHHRLVWGSLLAAAALSLLSGCDDHGHPHNGAAGAHAEQPGPGVEKLTNFSQHTALFVEFPRLVAGQASPFLVRLSTLTDFKALAAASVSAHLSSPGQPDLVFAVDSASQPGIFRLPVKPVQAGDYELRIEVKTAAFSVTHLLGPVTVFADPQAAAADPLPHDDDAITFTKEQQWKVDFASAEVGLRPIRAAVAATGNVRANPQGEALLSAAATGRIQAAGSFPQLGQTVQKGQLLAYLVPRLGGDTDLASLRAAARAAEVEKALADQELARLEQLYREGALAQQRVLNARASAALRASAQDAAQQRLGQFGGASGGVPIRAAQSGTLVDVRVAPGAFVQEGALLFHIADRRSLWLELRVAESDLARLGQPVGASFRVAGASEGIEIVPGQNGRLVAVGGVIDPISRTLPVVFELSGASSSALPIGIAVQAQVFSGQAAPVLAIAADSVIDENGLSVVFVQTGGESFERRTLRLGAREGDWVEVLDGLQPGQRVVSRGAWLIKLAATGAAAIGHGHAH
ncbi:efflux RND transporter periplasmic adaptor subunit [Hydrogenophaga sp.]|uniref:efflux RND transporter periplasmic adaptor subunit n=1 Tax=Hydrogenophaga sp. TaxID=1904254 RepID=UPI0019C3A6FD|nr:efflux RND transporter periplasmic adaptor subunit [Hydrogenophaga sp.]MBD3892282.1 efflux RND transporter periplasmic adaptor subunit [Hydrogenophaga sp.]